MAAAAQSQVRSLANAVAAVFASAPLTDAERRPVGIVHTDLPWTVPPLLTNLKLGDAELQSYLDYPLNTTAEALTTFLRATLAQMWHTPSRVMHQGTFTNLRPATPKARLGSRSLRFSTPIGYPGQIDDLAGVQLALEVAHAAYISLPVKDVISNNNDYYVVLADGSELGVKAGLPTVESPWLFNASAMVPDLLEMSRGPTSYECQYDQIASVRSIMYQNRSKFGSSFDAMDTALQALRFLALGTHCPDLSTALQVLPHDLGIWVERERAVSSAIEVMGQANISDRSKLETLEQLLVPGVIGISRFRREVFSSSHYPFSLAPGRADEISQWLRTYYETKVPCNLRKTA